MIRQEVLTGKHPYYNTPEQSVISKILSGRTPSRPTRRECTSFDLDILWAMCSRCWESTPGAQPTISGLLTQIKKHSATSSIAAFRLVLAQLDITSCIHDESPISEFLMWNVKVYEGALSMSSTRAAAAKANSARSKEATRKVMVFKPYGLMLEGDNIRVGHPTPIVC